MARQSRRYAALRKQLTDLEPQPVPEAVSVLKSLESKLPKGVKPCAFDQSVEIAVRLGVDPRQADQMVRGSLVLPHGIGKSQRVIVFAQAEQAQIAADAGADEVGGKELADKIKDGWLEFDVAIATPDMMGVVGPLGRVLGPRGLMPSPRAGTVTQDVATAVAEYKAGKVEFRVDSGGNIHCIVGKLSFSEDHLVENVEAFLQHLRALKPSASKGTYIRKIALTATMMPGIAVAV